MARSSWVTIFIAAALWPARDANAMCTWHNQRDGSECHALTQVCSGDVFHGERNCPPTSCAARAAGLTTPDASRAQTIPDFQGAIGHCAMAGTDAQVFDCAWNEVVRIYPDLALETGSCTKDLVRASPAVQQILAKAQCPPFPQGTIPGGCTNDRKCQLGCPPRDRTDVIAVNRSTVPFSSSEPCDQPDQPGPMGVVPFDRATNMPLYYAVNTPSRLLDASPPGAQRFVFQPDPRGPPLDFAGVNEGRLRRDLRDAAARQDPLNCSLPLAATYFARGDEVLGKAFADLSVTGFEAFHQFSAARPKQAYCESIRSIRLRAGCGSAPPLSPATTPEALVRGCIDALTRAYKVANHLRNGQVLGWNPSKAQERDALGWIAVSGEDDLPHRPVNVPSSDFPQYDVSVMVPTPDGRQPGLTVHSRFTVAQSNPPAWTRPAPPALDFNELPPLAIAANSEVLIFIHGMDSRAEEANDLINGLFAARRNRATNLVIIAVDLPSSGYAQTLDHLLISPLETVGSPKDLLGHPVAYAAALNGLAAAQDFSFTGKVPMLDFIENFIIRFIETVDQGTPIKSRIRAVMGGSLGGNMAFRLGRRCLAVRAGTCAPGEQSDMQWLPTFIVWSPASIWSSLGEGADLTKHVAPLTALTSASDFDPADPMDELKIPRMGRRAAFFGSWNKPIVPILVPMAQSDTWQSDFYLCKRTGLIGARLDRHETYDARFLLWHWRLGAEQLLFSHVSNDPFTGKPRYLSNTKRMMLTCGVLDDVLYNDICGAVQRTAPFMTTTPGKAMFLEMTGHSVDNERRMFFAGEVVQFLNL